VGGHIKMNEALLLLELASLRLKRAIMDCQNNGYKVKDVNRIQTAIKWKERRRSQVIELIDKL
jgi:ribosomal protein L29